jgi:hypothetical protein
MNAKAIITRLTGSIQESPIVDIDHEWVIPHDKLLAAGRFQFIPGIYGEKPGIAITPRPSSITNISKIVWIPDTLKMWAQKHATVHKWLDYSGIKRSLAAEIPHITQKDVDKIMLDLAVAASDILAKSRRLNSMVVGSRINPRKLRDTGLNLYTDLTEIEALEAAHDLGMTVQFATMLGAGDHLAVLSGMPGIELRRYGIRSSDYLSAGNSQPSTLSV